jgi:tryptophanyl-tRNA synthetase
MQTNKKQILSAIQPTGDLHLGNYFGAVRNWVSLQNEYDCFYGVVDNHSMTMPYDPKKLRENTWKMVFQLLACGVDPDNVFIQSLVPEHIELSWTLACNCSYGELTRMTQFKDKAKQVGELASDQFISAALLYYPILQAADILIYRADYVPVGKDQEQHLELARNIAERFNRAMGKDYFVAPEPLFTEVPKVLSLADPTKKMSKSLGEKHYINLFGDLQATHKKIKSAVTSVGQEGETSPGVNNLLEILKACNKKEIAKEMKEWDKRGALKYVDLKKEVSDALEELILPIQSKYQQILADKKIYKERIISSSERIRKVAQQTMREVRDLSGQTNLRY